MMVLPAAERFHKKRASAWVALISIILSFVIFAWAALIVNAHQQNEFVVERSEFAAAASKIYYGAPLGEVYTGIYEVISNQSVPLNNALEQAAHHQIPPGRLQGAIRGGSGSGYMMFATASMLLFGAHTSSIVRFMLCLMAASAAAFVSRFRDGRTVVVILYFSVLTFLVFTPLASDPNIPVGSFRYFSLVAILPAYHLWLESTEPPRPSSRGLIWTLLPMAVQVVTLVFAILCRNSAVPLIGAICVGWVAVEWRHRREPVSGARGWVKAVFAVAVASAFVGILALSLSKAYFKEGRLTEILWHRVFISLGVNPEWPFGKLHEMYDCRPNIPEGLVSGPEDRDGHCVFIVYAKEHNIPSDKIPQMVYGREYDAVLRAAFFHVFRLYPYQVLKTFLYYKPLLIPWAVKQNFHFKILEAPAPLAWLFFATVINIIIFATLAPQPARSFGQIVFGTILFAIFDSVSYLVAWALPHTTVDLLFFCLFAIGMGGVIAVAKLSANVFPHTRKCECN